MGVLFSLYYKINHLLHKWMVETSQNRHDEYDHLFLDGHWTAFFCKSSTRLFTHLEVPQAEFHLTGGVITQSIQILKEPFETSDHWSKKPQRVIEFPNDADDISFGGISCCKFSNACNFKLETIFLRIPKNS